MCEEVMIASEDREETVVQGDTKEEKVKEARQEKIRLRRDAGDANSMEGRRFPEKIESWV